MLLTCCLAATEPALADNGGVVPGTQPSYNNAGGTVPGEYQNAPAPKPNPRVVAKPKPHSTGLPHQVYIQGDSLSVELGPGLRHRLGGWSVRISAQVGRHVLTGLSLMRQTRLSPVVVFALGTNDYDMPGWWHRSQMDKAIRLAGPHRCVVLATVWGDGASRPVFNNQVRSLARKYGPKRVQVMKWAEAVRDKKVRLVDGTHPNSWGVRAAMMASAIKSCAAAR